MRGHGRGLRARAARRVPAYPRLHRARGGGAGVVGRARTTAYTGPRRVPRAALGQAAGLRARVIVAFVWIWTRSLDPVSGGISGGHEPRPEPREVLVLVDTTTYPTLTTGSSLLVHVCVAVTFVRAYVSVHRVCMLVRA